MSWSEHAFSFACAGEALVGIVSMPDGAAADTGVVVIVGGPQYRAGSHRQFTLLARAVASAGFAVLRFDVRGMGDSTGARRDFEAVSNDVAAAIDALQQQLPAVRRVVLWGLCDGASAALLYLHATNDPRVRGLCLANPWVRTEAGLARAHMKHYYLQRLRQPEFWRKVLSGRVASKAAGELWHNLSRSLARDDGHGTGRPIASPAAPFQERMADAAAGFRGKLLLLFSGDDMTAKEFLEHIQQDMRWRSALGRDGTSRCDFAHADHTFSDRDLLGTLLQSTTNWLRGLDDPSMRTRHADDAAAATRA